MIPRRLLSSLAGSCVVMTVFGCNAIVGNEDVDFTESTPTPTTRDGGTQGVGPDNPTPVKDGGASGDAEAVLDADAAPLFDAAIDD